MGKGDKKTKKGKIWLGSFGVSRSKKVKNKKAITKNPGSQAKPEPKPKKGEKVK